MKATQVIAAGVVVVLSFAAAPLRAAEHLVPSVDLRQQLADREHARSQNVEQLSEFFQSPAATQALAKAGMDAAQVSNTVASLDDRALEGLASRAAVAQGDVAAGAARL